MAKTWYPVIDFLTCLECGTCVDFCPHGVYDVAKAPTPVVKNPVECIDHCHGCGNKCPVGAITYAGDNTGWKPAHIQETEAAASCCACGCGAAPEKKVLIEYLYLDLSTCDRCIGTDTVLNEVVAEIAPALKLAGYTIDYQKHEIATPELATKYRFLSSPTVRVNGQDICTGIVETDCDCCGQISGTQIDCRVFEYEGNSYEVPPKAMLAERIFKAVFTNSIDCSCDSYEIPENLIRFFNGKANKAPNCSCGGNCNG